MENAGLESLKSLAAGLEINIVDSDKNHEIKQARREQQYVQKIKGFYKLLAVALLSLLALFIVAVNDASNWSVF
tara:strand:- start:2414 stop:2635 length:222 start_codon:yes stop_codon:yes gene_type:complete